MVGKRLLVEGPKYNLCLLLEHLPIALLIGQRRAEGLNFTGMVTPPQSKNHPAIGEYVGHGVILGQSQWVPHGSYIEPTAKSDVLGDMGQVDIKQKQVGDTLVSFGLEMVFSHPESIETTAV